MKPPRKFGGPGRGPAGGDRGRPDHPSRPSHGGEARHGPKGGDRPRGGSQGEARFGGGKFGGGKHAGPQRERPRGDHPRNDRAQGERPQGERLLGERLLGERPQGQRPLGERPQGQRPWSERPQRERPQAGFQPRHGENTLHARGTRHDEGARQPRDHREQRAGDRTGLWLYGTHAVAAALANPARRLRRLLLTEAAEEAIAARLPRPWPITAERAEREQLDRLLGRDAVHQGAALHADPLVPPPLAQVLERKGPLVVLDQLADPRNIGAILRSAAALGAACVIVQDRHAPEETGALAKAASGALETLPLLRAVNIARTLVALKAADVFVVGLDAAAPPLSGPSLADRRVALVMGAEGEGLRRLTRETCDTLAGIAIHGGGLLDSLNVSAACAIALYELGRR
jgi:23S rRNA (guanosine2251-2'-O)-methyltransferase